MYNELARKERIRLDPAATRATPNPPAVLNVKSGNYVTPAVQLVQLGGAPHMLLTACQLMLPSFSK